MASEPLSKSERTILCSDAEWVRDHFQPGRENSHVVVSTARYEATVVACEARIAELEPLMKLVDPLREIATRDPDLWGLQNAMLTARKALASIGEWGGKYDDSVLRKAEEWDDKATAANKRITELEQDRDSAVRMSNAADADRVRLYDENKKLREAAETASEWLRLYATGNEAYHLLLKLKDALK